MILHAPLPGSACLLIHDPFQLEIQGDAVVFADVETTAQTKGLAAHVAVGAGPGLLGGGVRVNGIRGDPAGAVDFGDLLDPLMAAQTLLSGEKGRGATKIGMRRTKKSRLLDQGVSLSLAAALPSSSSAVKNTAPSSMARARKRES